jgi:hypothetical protein
MIFAELLEEAKELSFKLDRAARYATVPNIWLAQEGIWKLISELEVVARARGELQDGTK